MERTSPADRLEELLAHRAWVRRVARALLLDESRADDLEQEAWLRALRGPAVRSPKAWLGTVLRNAASNLRRGETRRREHESATPPASPPPSPADLLERAEVVERVARAVRELEDPHRTVVLLRYFEDLAPPEVASRLGVPVETVRTRLKRALVLLRARLDAEEGSGRRRWMALLLPLAKPSVPGPPQAAAGGSSLAAAAGVVAMGWKVKVAVAAALLLLLGAGTWLLQSDPEVGADGRGIRSGPASPVAGSRGGRSAGDDAVVPPGDAGAALVRDVAVAGRVEDDTGVPVEGAAVSLLLPSREKPENLGTTDAEGRFSVARADPTGGPWILRVEAPGPAAAWRSPSREEAVHPGDRDLVVVLRRRPPGGSGASLRAEIVDARTGAACEASRVELVAVAPGPSGPRWLPVSIRPGLATAEGLRPGRWRIRAEVPSHGVAVKEFSVPEGDAEVSVRVEVASTGTVSGSVDREETPWVADILVQAIRRADLAAGESPGKSNVGEDRVADMKGPADRGFAFKDLEPGAYLVAAHGYERVEWPRVGRVAVGRAVLQVRPGETTSTGIRLRPAARVWLQREGPFPGQVVEFWIADGDGPFEWIRRCGGGGEGLNRDGPHFVPAGTLRWKARFLAWPLTPDAKEVAEALEGTLTLAEGEEAKLDLRGVPK